MAENLTMLIIDSDRQYAKNLTDYAKSDSSFLDADYALNGNDGLELAELIKPDVIVMDFLIPGLDAIGFLRMLKSKTELKKPFIIINSYTITSAMLAVAAEQGADYFMMKPQPPSELCRTIAELVCASVKPKTPINKREDDTLDLKITKLLHCMGVPAHLNGYSYIRSSIKIAMKDISAINPITRNLYPQLAKKYNKTPSSIERSIRHAIKVSWERGNKKVIHDIFGYSQDSQYYGCPTNSEYIAMAADDLKMRIKHNIAI